MQTGSGSNLQHYRKLRAMQEKGQLPESFNDKLEELAEQYEYIDFLPPPPLVYVWKTFWKIRRTKPFESPVNYTDLYHFQEISGIRFDVWEADIILNWDREYYHYADKNKE